MKELVNHLKSHLSAFTVVVVAADGGMGKTQFVLESIRKLKSSYGPINEERVYMMEAESPQKLADSFKDLATRMKIITDNSTDVQIRKDVLVRLEGHKDVASSLNNIGKVNHSQGNYADTLVNYNEALRIKELVYGNDHPDVATSLNNIGCVYENQGNYADALMKYNEALCIFQLVYSIDVKHPNIIQIKENVVLLDKYNIHQLDQGSSV